MELGLYNRLHKWHMPECVSLNLPTIYLLPFNPGVCPVVPGELIVTEGRCHVVPLLAAGENVLSSSIHDTFPEPLLPVFPYLTLVSGCIILKNQGNHIILLPKSYLHLLFHVYPHLRKPHNPLASYI